LCFSFEYISLVDNISGLPRKYLSGAAKRKLAEKKKCDTKKLLKISNFLQDNSESAHEKARKVVL